jgi:hypothetical protein
MAGALATICSVAFWFCAPLVLVARYVWPARLPWWGVFAAVSFVSWGALVLGDHFIVVHESECIPLITPDSVEGCPIVDYIYTYNREAGWLKGIIYLLPWLALYALIHIARRKRMDARASQPNPSLERP